MDKLKETITERPVNNKFDEKPFGSNMLNAAAC
jgi:hypothetical protein